MGRHSLMKLLLDTHIWIWMVLEPTRLSRRVAHALDDVKERTVALGHQCLGVAYAYPEAKVGVGRRSCCWGAAHDRTPEITRSSGHNGRRIRDLQDGSGPQ